LEIKTGEFLKKITGSDIICIDSSILIYHLEDIGPYNKLTKILIREAANYRAACIISALTITELLTKPYSLKDGEKIRLFKEFIRSLPNTTIKAIDYEIALKAAYVRAEYNLRTPDSMILATAFHTGCQLFITNDIALKKIKSDMLQIIILDDYLET
jgi:predicted nucleic acid-binding protein